MTTNLAKKPVKYLLRIVYLLCLSLLLGLGGWQLSRGVEKNQLEKTLSEQHPHIVIKNRAPSWDDMEYKAVELDGTWLEGKTFLLDNRIYRGQLGYEVLRPFRLAGDSSVVLVNLGWIAKDWIAENAVAGLQLASNLGSEKVMGQLYLPEQGFTLGVAYTNQTSWPKVIQYFDWQALSQAVGFTLQPVVVVLETDPKLGLVKIWSPYVINALRHFGYAVQWWGLALLLIIFGFIWSRHNTRHNGEHRQS